MNQGRAVDGDVFRVDGKKRKFNNGIYRASIEGNRFRLLYFEEGSESADETYDLTFLPDRLEQVNTSKSGKTRLLKATRVNDHEGLHAIRDASRRSFRQHEISQQNSAQK